MKPAEDQINQLSEHGWVLIEDFLSQDEISTVREALSQHYPSVEAYEAKKQNYAHLQGDPFAGLMLQAMFPKAKKAKALT